MVALLYNTKSESITVSATAGGASGDVLYTCPPNHDCTLDVLLVSNGGTASKKISIQFYHNDDSTYHNLVKEHAVAGNDIYNVFSSAQFHLHAGDKIVVYMEAGSTFDVTMSGREYYNPARPS